MWGGGGGELVEGWTDGKIHREVGCTYGGHFEISIPFLHMYVQCRANMVK